MADFIEKLSIVLLIIAALSFGCISITSALIGFNLFDLSNEGKLIYGILLLVAGCVLAFVHKIQYDTPFWHKETIKERQTRLSREREMANMP